MESGKKKIRLNRRMAITRRKYFLVLTCLLYSITGYGQLFDFDSTATERKAEIRTDTSSIVLRTFDDNKVDQVRQNKLFRYDHYEEKEESNGFVSWLAKKIIAGAKSFAWMVERGLRWFSHLMAGLTGMGALGIVAFVLIVAGLAVVIFLLMRATVRRAFQRKPVGDNEIDYTSLEENIHELNFDSLIETAVGKGQYRLAIRLHYLKALKVLSDRNVIHWMPEKTNRDYLRELGNSPIKKGFSAITYIFEHIWYGEFPISKEQYHSASHDFHAFLKEVREGS